MNLFNLFIRKEESFGEMEFANYDAIIAFGRKK